MTEEVDGEIIAGELSSSCGRRYPIIKAIPRFIDGIRTEQDLRRVYADSFGHQWTTYNWEREVDEQEFFSITDLRPEDLAEKVVFDGGCGGGRFARVVTKYCKEFVGLDFSIAVDKAYELCKDHPHAHFLQCDINNHPLKSNQFDFVYSHGVIHHTPDTKKAFDNLPRLVKEGGLLYLAVFRWTFGPMQIPDRLLRSALNKLPIPVLDKVCGGLSYVSNVPNALFLRRFFWFSLQPTHEIRKCCNYDWYGPTYHHEHTIEEVQGWFESAGFPSPRYINAWPYAPPEEKYTPPDFFGTLKLGTLLGVIARRGAPLAT